MANSSGPVRGSTVFIPTSSVLVRNTQHDELVRKDESCISAVTGSVSSSEKSSHVVTIQINQKPNKLITSDSDKVSASVHNRGLNRIKQQKEVSIVNFTEPINGKLYQKYQAQKEKENFSKSIYIQPTPDPIEMVQKSSNDLDINNSNYLYYLMASGQCSPSDTLDSGTCSDLENTPPPLPKKMSPKNKSNGLTTFAGSMDTNCLSVTKPHKNLNDNITDSEESESSLSCDSLNSSEFNGNNCLPPLITDNNKPKIVGEQKRSPISFLPNSLLQDIREHSNKIQSSDLDNSSHFTEIERSNGENDNIKKSVNTNSNAVSEQLSGTALNKQQRRNPSDLVRVESYLDREHSSQGNKTNQQPQLYDSDQFYKFHINEHIPEVIDTTKKRHDDEETFAGYKDIHSATSTIRSSKGTVRGVKNRVRNGIATFLQMQQSNVKNYKEKDAGKVVLYSTSMGIVRETYAKCANVKQILRTLLIKFEERDVFMSCEYQQEIKDRMQSDMIQVPQLFVDGQHIGDAECVERLNESGELRKMLKAYKSMDSTYTCQTCGGYRLLPCPSCNGSKKSVHRNHFTTEFVALKCMNCDEVGLVKCHSC